MPWGSFHAPLTSSPEQLWDGGLPLIFGFFYTCPIPTNIRLTWCIPIWKACVKQRCTMRYLRRFFIISFSCWSSSTSLKFTKNETLRTLSNHGALSYNVNTDFKSSVTSACLHPDRPLSHFVRPQSPSASASTSSPAVAPLRTSDDLWYQADKLKCSAEKRSNSDDSEPVISYLASPAACEVPPPHLAAAAPAPESWLWDVQSLITC